MAWFTNPYIVGILGAGAGYLSPWGSKKVTVAVGAAVGAITSQVILDNTFCSHDQFKYVAAQAIKAGYFAIKMPDGIKTLQTVKPPVGKWACTSGYQFVPVGTVEPDGSKVVVPYIRGTDWGSCFGAGDTIKQSQKTQIKYPVYTQKQIEASVSTK